jgi:hypothetical protein
MPAGEALTAGSDRFRQESADEPRGKRMKTVSWMLGLLMALAVGFFGLQVIASESGEVVVLYTDDGGEAATTRLWVVDDEGHQWLRAGAESGWYARLTARPEVELERDGVRRRYLAQVEPAMTPRINQLMKDKYAWREDVVSVLAGSRDEAMAIRLTPVD